MKRRIDVTFDFRSDTPPEKDPDTLSPTLRAYHRLLWSKPLPNGVVFQLEDTTPNVYLHHRSEIGEYCLSSDAVVATFRNVRSLASLRDQMSADELEEFVRLSYTIGGMMIFPRNRVDGKMTINGARGCDRHIKDRFDLTVECIRRHYRSEPSPLSDTLARYAQFFGLFRDFAGYVEFFLLQDLVIEDYSAVRFSLPFEEFNRSPLPVSLESYRSYKKLAIEFIQARNRRILEYVARLPSNSSVHDP
jgi:hypothetical protein